VGEQASLPRLTDIPTLESPFQPSRPREAGIVVFTPSDDYGLSNWAISHPLAVATTPSEPGQSAGWASLCSVTEFRLCICRPLRYLGRNFRSFRRPEPCKSAAVRLQQRRRAVSIGLVSLRSHAASRLAVPLGLDCAGVGATAGRVLGELLSDRVAEEVSASAIRLSLPPRRGV
jgi:hypothetical protein